MEERSVTYNEQEGLRLTGSLQVEALQRATQEVVHRHEVFRTNYKSVDGSPVRVIHTKLDMKLPIIDLQHLRPEEKLSEVQRLSKQKVMQLFVCSS